MEEQTNFQNITNVVFVSNPEDERVSRITGTIKQRASGVITIDPFSAQQLLKAFSNAFEKRQEQQKEARYDREESKIINKLFAPAFAQTTVAIRLDRNEIIMLKDTLEVRMHHCEEERDRRSEAFNPDTYISMKLLLISLREWLLGELVSTDEE